MINEDFARIYRETVGRAGKDGISRLDAFEEAQASILTAIRAGDLELDVESAVRSALQDIDRRDGRSADRVVHEAAQGLVPLEGVGIELVVVLGGGLRKQWTYVTAVDMQRMDRLRFDNLRQQQDKYADWHVDYSRVLPVLFQFETFGAAVSAGAFSSTVQAGAA